MIFVENVTSFPGSKAEEILDQFLDAFALPEVVAQLATRCLPQVVLSKQLWTRVATAQFSNVVLVVKHLRLTPLDEAGKEGDKNGWKICWLIEFF